MELIDPGYTYYEGPDEFFVVFYLLYMLIMFAVGIGMYVLQSVGMYSVAKRRGIRKPWLAWLPVGSDWMLGCISDQYRYVTKGQIKNKRKTLLILQIILWVLCAAFFAAFISFVVQTAGAAFNSITYDPRMDELMTRAIGSFFAMVGFGLVMTGVSVAVMVIRYMAYYDLYCSCDPRNGVLYLVLSIFITVTQSIFVFLCRNKDEGMPPRKAQPERIAEPWEGSPEE